MPNEQEEIIECVKQKLAEAPSLGITLISISFDSSGVLQLVFRANNGNAPTVGPQVTARLCGCSGLGQYSVTGEDPPVGGGNAPVTYQASGECSG